MTTSKRVALVTGASAGIGAVYADRLAKRGYDLVLVARDLARMAALGERLRGETGVAVEVIPADLTLDSDITKVEQRLAAGDVTLLVNNAGMSMKGGILENGAPELSRIIALNVTAPTRLASAAAKAFAAKGAGAIVNLSSVLALAPEMFEGVYSGTKAHLLNLSQAMAAQLKDKGVYVQVVLPARRGPSFGKRPDGTSTPFPRVS